MIVSRYVSGVKASEQVANEVRAAVDRRAIAARNLVLVTKPGDLALERNSVTQAHQEVKENLKKLIELARTSDARSRTLVEEIDRVEALYGPVALDIVGLALEGKHEQAISKMNDDCRPLLAALEKATREYSNYTATIESELVKESLRSYAAQRNLLLTICLASLLAAILAGWQITRSLLRALGAEPDALSSIAHRVATGDISAVQGAVQAPTGSVLASMGQMQSSLAKLIGDVRGAAENIAAGSSQIAAGNVDLSSRTEQQASSLQETATSMEQLTATVKQNAENAQQASTLSSNASEVAQKGNHVVGQVVATMQDISENSTKVAEITGIIEGIACQTNILALNAAVEAARAGEQGRGFAVVASEVRSLAQRSSTAAREIKELITSSVQRIGNGSELAGEAGKTMAEVTWAVARVTDIMGEIAAASGEQSRGIEQVNLAIAQMDSVTQQNAALVEEAAAASQSLENQGRHLTSAIAFFTLTDDLSSAASRDASSASRSRQSSVPPTLLAFPSAGAAA